eukprot:gene41884-39638_t
MRSSPSPPPSDSHEDEPGSPGGGAPLDITKPLTGLRVGFTGVAPSPLARWWFLAALHGAEHPPDGATTPTTHGRSAERSSRACGVARVWRHAAGTVSVASRLWDVRRAERSSPTRAP